MAGARVYVERVKGTSSPSPTMPSTSYLFILTLGDGGCALLFAELIKGGSGAVKMWSVPTSSSLLLLLLGWCQLLRTHTLAELQMRNVTQVPHCPKCARAVAIVKN